MGKYLRASIRTLKRSSRKFENEDVYVQESAFLKDECDTGGLGLYASRPYRKGDVVQEYKGNEISDRAANMKSRSRQYMFDVKGANGKVLFVIDAARASTSSAARYTNAVLDYNDPRRNAEFKQYDQKIYLVASKPIKTHQEIISFYGADTSRVICEKR